MNSNLIRVILLAASIVLGLFYAYALGLMNNTTEDTKDNFEEMFVMLGEKELKGKKRFLYKLSLLIWIIYVPYFLLAFHYFYPQTIPFNVTIILGVVVLGDYIYQMNRIKKAVDIREVAVINRLGKIFTILTIVMMAILTAYLI